MDAHQVKAGNLVVFANIAHVQSPHVVDAYNDCKMTNSPIPLSPHLCEKEARAMKQALESIRIEPICVGSVNDARECLFQTDMALYNCKGILAQVRQCVKDPAGFKDFLEHSTRMQRGAARWDFFNHSGQGKV